MVDFAMMDLPIAVKMGDFDMMDVYYPNTSDDENSPSVLPEPTELFTPSWCRNGHSLRIEPGATVVFIATYTTDLSIPPPIRINGHGHPMMDQGVVHAINHVDKTVQIGPLGKPIDWDLVVGRLDSKHQSIPIALYGSSNELVEPDLRRSVWKSGFLYRETVDDRKMTIDVRRSLYIQSLMGFEVKQGTLASVALRVLKDSIVARAAMNGHSFFYEADKTIV